MTTPQAVHGHNNIIIMVIMIIIIIITIIITLILVITFVCDKNHGSTVDPPVKAVMRWGNHALLT